MLFVLIILIFIFVFICVIDIDLIIFNFFIFRKMNISNNFGYLFLSGNNIVIFFIMKYLSVM